MSETAEIAETRLAMEKLRRIPMDDLSLPNIDAAAPLVHNELMSTPSREEIDAKIGRASAEFNSSVIGLRKDMDVGFAGVREEFAVVRQDMKVGFAELRSDMHKMHSDTTKWIIATVISLFLGFAGIFFVMSNSAKQPQQAPSQPVIINVPAAQAPAMPTPTPQSPGK